MSPVVQQVAFLLCYLAFPIVALLIVRNLVWLAVYLAAVISGFGLLVGFAMDTHIVNDFDMTQLQIVLLIALGSLVPLAWWQRRTAHAPWRRQVVAIGVPIALIVVAVTLITFVLQPTPAFFDPVAYFMGHPIAEDNAKWLDFTAQLASQSPIQQGVPLGGPLQLPLVFVATCMSVLCVILVGGINQVAVAANSVIYTQYLLAGAVPLALAPIAVARIRGVTSRVFIPWPVIWAASLILTAISILLTRYGHLTFQFTLAVIVLWAATFLAGTSVRRAHLLTSLVVAAAMTVWFPLNAIAIAIILGWLVFFVVRAVRGRGLTWPRRYDILGLVLVVAVAVALWEPVRSAIAFSSVGVGLIVPGSWLASMVGLDLNLPAVAMPAVAMPSVASPLDLIRSLFERIQAVTSSPLFTSNGGTEQTGPILAGLAAVSLVLAAMLLRDDPWFTRSPRPSGRIRFLPLGMIIGYGIALELLDLWSTGSGPHYGAVKMMFLVSAVTLGVTLPFAVARLDLPRVGMTLVRAAAVLGVLYLLVIDSVLPRAAGEFRSDQWNPPIQYNNPRGHWWPAEVRPVADQTITGNPVACVYLPPGARVPSAITDQLPNAQLVYTCSRLLSGLSGTDATAQPLIDWLRREWLTNTRAWSDVYDGLIAMPPQVQAKPVILLDEGGNVVGMDTVGSMLARYPKFAGKDPQERAALEAAAAQSG